MIPEGFHLLRPAWLLALPLVVPLIWSALRRRRSGGAWRRACDPHLLAHLMGRSEAAAPRWPLALAAAGWITACLALAGPSWERLPQPAFEEPMQTVLALELSQSMDARDLTPSRLSRARYELLDALELLDGGVGLVIFAEEPYAVTPITDDAQVIAEMVPVLASELMPGRGTRLDRAVDEAHALLEQAGAARGHIVVFADGVGDDRDASYAAARRAARDGYPVSVLDFAGDDALAALAEAGSGRYAAFSTDDGDLEHVLSTGAPGAMPLDRLETSGIQADVWRDMGAWLVLAPLLLAPLAFRRGWAAALGLLLLAGAAPSESQARSLDELWQRSDQQGARAFDAGRHADAAELFEDPAWRGAAYYRDANYAAAAEALQALGDPRSRYNLGNALARSGQLEQAIAAYDEVLATEPDHEDARHNRELVKKLLEQRQQQEQQQQQSNGSGAQDGKNEPSENGEDESQQHEAGEPSENGHSGAQGQGDRSEQPESGDSGEQSESARQGSEGQPDEASGRPDSSGENDRSAAGAEHEPQQGAPDGSRDRDGDAAQPSPVAHRPAEGEPGESGEAPAPGPGPHGESPRELSEHDQAAEQWLNRIPDDPGGLLREKLRRRYAERRYRERWAR